MDKVKQSKPPVEDSSLPQEPVESSIKPPCCFPCSKPIWCLLLVIFLAVVAIVTGYYLLVARRTTPVVLNQQPSITPMPTPTPLPSRASMTEGDPTSNWKTYTSQSNFEFKYPQTWDYYKYQVERVDIAFGPKELIKVNRERLDNPNIAALIGGKAWPVEIKSFNGNLYLYGPNEVSFISDAQKKVTSKEIVVNGITAVRHTIEFDYNAPYISKGDIIEVVIVRQGTKSYSITLSDQKYKDIFDQILSTFRFD